MHPKAFLSKIAGACVFFFSAIALHADINNLPPGYSIQLVSTNISTNSFTSISQLAFKPGDMNHVYAARNTQFKVSRYEYNPVTGFLTNETMIATNTDRREIIGLGFHSTNIYVTFDYGGSRTVRPGDGRIARYFNTNASGVFQSRHDFVHSLDKGDHDLNMIKMKGDSLYVGIGAASRNGDPARDNIYTMTIARVPDLNQIVSLTNQIGSNFKGLTNYLPTATEWVSTNVVDGYLHYFASGFRNPFGINFDADGDLWVSSNGNNDPGFGSQDWLYKKVFLGAQGDFPPPAFGFTNYITGTPIAPFADFGVSTAVAGLDFIREGPDAGKVLLVQSGASNTNDLGRDLHLIDPNTGSHQQIYQFKTNQPLRSTITDVLRDPYGRFLIADYTRGNIWLLRTPLPAPQLSAVATNGNLRLSWPLIGVEYKLEQTSDLTPTASWQLSTAVVQIDPNEIRVDIAPTNTAQFFRLKK